MNQKFIKIFNCTENIEINSIESQDAKTTCIMTETDNMWIFGGHKQVTLVDKHHRQVIARLPFREDVRGICITKDQRYMYVQDEDEVIRYNLQECHYQVNHKLNKTKQFILPKKDFENIYRISGKKI